MTTQPVPPPPIFVDLPTVTETFADSAPLFYFDGQTLRITFAVTRADDPVPGKPMTTKQYPVARVVMPAQAGLELIDKLRGMVEEMIKKGALKPIQAPPAGQRPS